LRALAVGAVLVFHIWPALVPGGFVGVDVFFVISGYLITLGLIREVDAKGAISLPAFYARRARRILPAASAVLLVVAALTLMLLPTTRWEDAARQIAGSAVYLENWLLAGRAVDYMAMNAKPGPVQHFWSLSIEEQFYLVWPVLVLGLAALAGRRRPVLLAGFAAVVVASLAVSVILTASGTPQAYFVTQTRVWELALGGVLAVIVPAAVSGRVAGAVLGTVGLAAILSAAFVFSGATPFPGWAALLPTLGAALVIAGGTARGLVPPAALNAPILQYVGDRSYSIYLWHWPVVVFFPLVTAQEPGWMAGAVVLVVTLAISELSYRFVETPFRRRTEARALRVLGYAGISIAACVAAAAVIFMAIDRDPPPVIALHDPDYPGPAALVEGAPVPDGVPFVPQPIQLTREPVAATLTRCNQTFNTAEPKACIFGSPGAETRIVLVGDSLAGHWLAPILEIVEAKGWGLRSYTKGSCPFLEATVVGPDGKPYETCRLWVQRVLEELERDPPDILLTAQSYYTLAPDSASGMEDGRVSLWRKIEALGTRIVAINGLPRFPFSPAECLEAGKEDCRGRRSELLTAVDDPYPAAGRTGASVVDMTDAFCGPEWCDAIVGNVLAFRDQVHMTSTFARLLAPYLASRAGFDDMPSERPAGGRRGKRAKRSIDGG
jgi:peptidoglycan/LPS O-acetylase OafA/YrhL